MKADMQVSEGYVSARLTANGYSDAARSGEVVGLEVEVDDPIRVHAGDMTRENGYRAERLLILDMGGTTKAKVVTIQLMVALGFAVLTDSEWSAVVHACELAGLDNLAGKLKANEEVMRS